MADYFAVIDVGSNALRFQVACAEKPGTYRVVEQTRRPIRLGQSVFQTGKVDNKSIQRAVSALKKFKDSANGYHVTRIRAVATSALREASNRAEFLSAAKNVGVKLEVISEQEEARLISLGIMSGLSFDLPLGLFVDIGGGSVEVVVANRTNTFCLFSLPLGAVRLTEKFISKDPPKPKELKNLERFSEEAIQPIARRVRSEKFAMSFGSGGTITALADADLQLTGEPRAGSLSVLRRDRLGALLRLMKGRPQSARAPLIPQDPKRADIIIAGASVLDSLMNHLGIDYIFVSKKGLRDGVMRDLLQNRFPEHQTPWTEEGARPDSVEAVGKKYQYDSPHAYQVSHLALRIFYQLQNLHRLDERYAAILHAAAMLHDVGLFIEYPKHHRHSYYLIKSSGLRLFSKIELDLIANIARYHRKAHPSPKHLPFSQLSPLHQEIVRKLSAILRVADGLDLNHESRVKDVVCSLAKGKTLNIKVQGELDLSREFKAASSKAKLLSEVFNLETVLQSHKRRIR
ncbi:MAG: HD domain-containing protein [Deltaproteobacteria bacterium]|nr:HD domain-containing protein [Deltaproteobacteria bacterium]